MPHIHTDPDQHDITVSAYVIRRVNDEWKCLVHYHRKMDVLAQVGGHIELHQTPWQAVAAELAEESGYSLAEVKVLQPPSAQTVSTNSVAHPVPFASNTYNVGDDHYHSDFCYGFVASNEPKSATAEGESDDLRWHTVSELEALAVNGEVIAGLVDTYRVLICYADTYDQIDGADFSIEKPAEAIVTYKRGRASEKRNH